MNRQNFCESCDEKETCQQAYKELGRLKGPSILSKILMAFLLPMAVFIFSAVFSNKIIGKAALLKYWQPIIVVSLSFAVTFLSIVIIKFATKLRKNK